MGDLETAPPITLTAWTDTGEPDYVRRGPIDGAEDVEITADWNGPKSVTFTIDDDHPAVEWLDQPGSRVVAQYVQPADGGRPLVVSGPVEEIEGVDLAAGTRSYLVNGDWSVFGDVVAWPNPTGRIDQQGDEGAYHVVTGPAETVLTKILAPNARRQGVPVEIPASAGRGAVITASMRMHTIADRLIPQVDLAGIGADIVQVGRRRHLVVTEPRTVTRVLTQDSGAVVSGSFRLTGPPITRVVVGAGGEGEKRLFIEVIDHDLEAAGWPRRQVFVDARDIKATDPENPGYDPVPLMTERAAKALAEGSPRSALQVELAETPEWAFGKALQLGDAVTVRLTGTPPIPDRVRSVTVSWNSTNGLLVTPRIGQWQDTETDEIYTLVAALAARQRDTETR